MKKIVFLRRELLPDNIAVYRALLKRPDIEIHVFYCQPVNRFSLILPSETRLVGHAREDLSENKLWKELQAIKPDLIYCNAGHADKIYLKSLRKFHRTYPDIPVVTGCDTQWRGTWRQWLGSLIAPFYIHNCFSHICIAGCRQYEYAVRMGYRKENILLYGLSGNTDLFSCCDLASKENYYPHRFLFVGRFVDVKGLDFLFNAWQQIDEKKDWKLVLVGDGDLGQIPDGVEVFPAASQDQLLDYAKTSGCFVLPSRFEQWSLVIHEFAAAGLPLICTQVCGASSHFLINGYNGYCVPAQNSNALAVAMKQIMNLPDDALFEMGKRSRNLAMSITPEITAAAIYSVLD